MMTKKKSWTVSATAVLSTALVVGSSMSGGVQALAQTSSQELTVAVVAPFSGNESFIGPRFLSGVQVAVQAINAHGGILGHKVRVVTADTAGDPVDAVPAVTQVIAIKHPFAMIGPSSLEITAVMRQLNQDKLVDVTLGGTTELDHMNLPYIFRTSPSDSQLGVAMAYYGIHKGYKKAALVFDSSSSAQTLDGPVKTTLEKHGVQVAVNESIVSDQSSYRSEIEKLINGHPQVIFMQVDPQTASTFFSELRELGGGNIPVIGSDVTAAADFAKAVGYSYAEKELTSVQGSTVGGSAADIYTKLYGNMFKGQQPVTLSNSAYDAMNVVALAATMANSTQPSVYVKDMVSVANGPGKSVFSFAEGEAALTKHQKINYQGASGPTDFDKYHNVTGAFEAVRWNSSGSKMTTLAQITPQELFKY